MKPCSILVVDDEPGMRDMISQVLTAAGHHVMIAGDGQQAIKLMGEHRFDLVVTDVIMPERDGIEVIGELRRKRPQVRIIAMSGGGHVPVEQYLKIAKGVGAHAVLEKPFSNRALLDTIEKLLPDPAAPRPPQSPNSTQTGVGT